VHPLNACWCLFWDFHRLVFFHFPPFSRFPEIISASSLCSLMFTWVVFHRLARFHFPPNSRFPENDLWTLLMHSLNSPFVAATVTTCYGKLFRGSTAMKCILEETKCEKQTNDLKFIIRDWLIWFPVSVEVVNHAAIRTDTQQLVAADEQVTSGSGCFGQ